MHDVAYTRVEEWNWDFLLSVHRGNTLADIPPGQGAFGFHWLVDGKIEATLDGNKFRAEAPCLLCLGSRDRVVTTGGYGEIRSAIFHPAVINDSFMRNDVYDITRFQGTTLSDQYYLHPFMLRSTGAPVSIPLSLALVDRMQELFDRMESELKNKVDGFWPCRTRSHLLEALILTRQGFTGPVERDFAEQLLVYLHTHYSHAYSLDGLASRFATNRTTLSTRFRERTGQTVGDYLRGLRIRVAGVLLRDTTLPVQEIIDRSGFSDPSHFVRLFKRETGMTPTEYRKTNNWILAGAK